MIPKSMMKFADRIDDWYEPSGEEFKYDVMLKIGYAYEFNRRVGDVGVECRTIEQFNTIAEARQTLSRVKVVSEKNCAVCRFFQNGKCIK